MSSLKKLKALRIYDSRDPRSNGGFTPFFPCAQAWVIAANKTYEYNSEGQLVVTQLRDKDVIAARAAAICEMLQQNCDRITHSAVNGLSVRIQVGEPHGVDCDITVKQKTMKRLKALNDFMVISETPLRIKVIEDPSKEKVLDGAYWLNEDTWRKIIKSKLQAKDTSAYFKELLFHAHIVRGVGLTKEGYLKGHGFLTPPSRMGGYDIITHRANLKSEITYEGYRMGWNPKTRKGRARTNIQSLLNLPFLRREAMDYFMEELNYMKWCIHNDHPLETAKALMLSLMEMDEEVQESVMYHYRKVALAFHEAGGSLRNSKILMKQVWRAHMDKLFRESETGKVKPNVPIPCSRYGQVISQELAGRIGILPANLRTGELKWDDAYGVGIVTNEDWENHLMDWGGCDLDDEFSLIYRNDEVIVFRSPNDVGEYGVFKAVGTKPVHLSYRSLEGQPTRVTSMKSDWSDLPPRNSTLGLEYSIDSGGAKDETPREYGMWYTINTLQDAIEGRNPGSYVNSKGLLTLLTGKQAKAPLASMETVIDICTQGGRKDDIDQIFEWSDGVVQYVTEKCRPVDLVYAHNFPKKVREAFVTKSGWLTQLTMRIRKEKKDSWAWVEKNYPFVLPHWVKKPGTISQEDRKVAEEMMKVFLAEWGRAGFAPVSKKLFEMLEQKTENPVRTLHFFAKHLMTKTNKSDSVLISMHDPGLWEVYQLLIEE